MEDHRHRTIWKWGTSGKQSNNSDYQQQTGFKSIYCKSCPRIHLKHKKSLMPMMSCIKTRPNIIHSCTPCEWHKLYEPFDAFFCLFGTWEPKFIHSFRVSIFGWTIPLILLLWNKSTNLCEINLERTMQTIYDLKDNKKTAIIVA